MNYLFNKPIRSESPEPEQASNIVYMHPEELNNLENNELSAESSHRIFSDDVAKYSRLMSISKPPVHEEMEMEPVFEKKKKSKRHKAHKLHKLHKRQKLEQRAMMKAQLKRGRPRLDDIKNIETEIDDEEYFKRLEEERAQELLEEKQRKLERKQKKAEVKHLQSLYGRGRPKTIVDQCVKSELKRHSRKQADEYIEFETERDRRIHWRDATGNFDNGIIDNIVGNNPEMDYEEDLDHSDYEVPLPLSPKSLEKQIEEEFPFVGIEPGEDSSNIQSMDIIKLRRRAPPLHIPKSSDDLPCPNEYVLDILGIYEPIRRYHRVLRISPFRLEDFIMAISSRESSSLLSEIHIVLLKVILREDELLGSILSVPDCKDSINLSFYLLDRFSWPFILKSYLDGLYNSVTRARAAMMNNPDHSNNVIFNCNTAGGADRMLSVETLDPSVIPLSGEYPNVSLSYRIKVLTGLVTMFLSTGIVRGEILKQGIEPHEDHCRICHESGEVLCCDSCPAVFHLSCFKPPLTSVPASTWICPVCEKNLVEGLTDCISPEEKAGFAHRYIPIGKDRAGRVYWYMARRIFVETVDLTQIEPYLPRIIPGESSQDWEKESIFAAKKRKLKRDGCKIDDGSESDGEAYSTDCSTSCSEDEQSNQPDTNKKYYPMLCDPIKEYANEPKVYVYSTFEQIKTLRSLLSNRWEAGLIQRLDKILSRLETEMSITHQLTEKAVSSFLDNFDKFEISKAFQNKKIIILPVIKSKLSSDMKPDDYERILPSILLTKAKAITHGKENLLKSSSKGTSININLNDESLSCTNIDRITLCSTKEQFFTTQPETRDYLTFIQTEVDQMNNFSIDQFDEKDRIIHFDSCENSTSPIVVPFRLGDEGVWRTWVNRYTQEFGILYPAVSGRDDVPVNIALSRMQHYEEKESKKLLMMKFSLVDSFTKENFEYIQPVTENPLQIISNENILNTMKYSIIYFESFLPLGLTSPIWRTYRGEWLKKIHNCKTTKELTQLLIQLESIIRPSCFHRLWMHSIGCMEVERITIHQKEEDKRMRLLDRSGLTLPGYMTPELLKKASEMSKNIPPSTVISTKNSKGIIHTIWKMKGEEYRRLGGDGWCWTSKSLKMITPDDEINSHKLILPENQFIGNMGMQHGLGWGMFPEYLESEIPSKPPQLSDCRGHICHPMTQIPLYMNKRRVFYKIPVEKIYIPRRENDPFEGEVQDDPEERSFHNIVNVSRGLRYRIHYREPLRKDQNKRDEQIRLAQDPNSSLSTAQRRRLLFNFDELLHKRLQAKSNDKVAAESAKDDVFAALKAKDEANFAYQEIIKKIDTLANRAQELRTAKARAMKAKQNAMLLIKQENERNRMLASQAGKKNSRKPKQTPIEDENVPNSSKRRSGRAQKKANIHPDFIAEFDEDEIDHESNNQKKPRKPPVKKNKKVMDDFIVNDDEVDESGSLTETEESDIGQYDGANDKFSIDQLDGTKRSRNDSSDDAGALIDDDEDPEFDIGDYVESKKRKTSQRKERKAPKKFEPYEDEDFDSGPHSSEDSSSDGDQSGSGESKCSTFSDYEGEKKKKKKEKHTKKVSKEKIKSSPMKSKSKLPIPSIPSTSNSLPDGDKFVSRTLKEKKKLWKEMKKIGFSREERRKYFHLQKKEEKRRAKETMKSNMNSPMKKSLKRLPETNKSGTTDFQPTSQPVNKKQKIVGYEDEIPEGGMIFPSRVGAKISPTKNIPNPNSIKKTPQIPSQPPQKIVSKPPEEAKFKSVQIVRGANGFVRVMQQPKIVTVQQKSIDPNGAPKKFTVTLSSQGKPPQDKVLQKPITPVIKNVEKPIGVENNLSPKLQANLDKNLQPSVELNESQVQENSELKPPHRPSILKRKPKITPDVQREDSENNRVIAQPTPASKKILPTISIQNSSSQMPTNLVKPNMPNSSKPNVTFSLPNGLSVRLAKPAPIVTNSIAAEIAAATAKKISVQKIAPSLRNFAGVDLSKVRQITPNSVMIPNLKLKAAPLGNSLLPIRPQAPLVLDASHDIEIDKIVEELDKVDIELMNLKEELQNAEDKLNKATENLHNEQLKMDEATKGTSQPYSLNKVNWKKYSNLKWPGKKLSKTAKNDIETLIVALPLTMPPLNKYYRTSVDGKKHWSPFAVSPKNIRSLILSAGRKEMIRYEAEKKRVTQAIWPYPSSRPCMAEAWRYNLTKLTSSENENSFLYEIGVISNHMRILWSNIKWVDVLYDPIDALLDPPANRDHCAVAVDHKGVLYSRQPSDINECFILRRIIEVEPLDRHWNICNFLLRTESYKNVVQTIDIESIGEFFQKISEGRFFKRRKKQFTQDLDKLGLGPKKRGRKPGQVKKETADPDYDPNFDDFDEVKPGKKGRGRPKKRKRPEKESDQEEKESSEDSCDPYEDLEECDPNYIPSLEEMDEIIPGLATTIMEDGESKITGHGISSTIDDWIAEEGLLLWEIRYLMDCFCEKDEYSETAFASRLTEEKDWPILLPKEVKKEDVSQDCTGNIPPSLSSNNLSGESNKENEDMETDSKPELNKEVKSEENNSPVKMQKIVELLKEELKISGLSKRAKFCLQNGLIQSCIKTPPTEEQLNNLKLKEEKIKKMIELKLPEIPTPVINESFNDSTHIAKGLEQKKKISSLINNDEEKALLKKQSASQAAKVSAIVRRAKAVKVNIEARAVSLKDLFMERRNLTETIHRLTAQEEYAKHMEIKEKMQNIERENNKITKSTAKPKKTTSANTKRGKKEDSQVVPKTVTKTPSKSAKKSTKQIPKGKMNEEELSDLSDELTDLPKPLVSSRRGVLTPSTKLKPAQTKSAKRVLSENEAPKETPSKRKVTKSLSSSTKSKTKSSQKPKATQNIIQEQDDPEKLYCLCKKPYDYSAKYIGCDICLDWFHFECVNMTDDKMKELGESWQCPKCTSSESRLYCSCKEPYDKDRIYIACDSCDEWYHPECVGMTNEEASNQKDTDVYICPSCKEKEFEDHSLPEGYSIVDLNESIKTVPDKLADRFKFTGELLEKTNDFLCKLHDHPMAWPFIKPYDENKYSPAILKTILSPIDIETIISNMESGSYSTLLDLSRDLNLIFENSKLAHLDEAVETKCAELLEIFVEREMAKLRQITPQQQ